MKHNYLRWSFNNEHKLGLAVFNIMKKQVFTTIILVLFLCEVVPAIENPIGSPRLWRVPQSSIRDGLVPSPNPVDTSSNLGVIGNISEGKLFRSIAPYQANASFVAPPGSTSLDSFVRDAARSGDIDLYTGRYVPYYSSSGTSTIIKPGYSGVFGLARQSQRRTGIVGRAANVRPLAATPEQQPLADLDTTISHLRFDLRSISPQELEKLISEGVGTDAQAKQLINMQNLGHIEQLRRELKEISGRTPQSMQNLLMREDRLKLSTILESSQSMRDSQQLVTQLPKSIDSLATSEEQTSEPAATDELDVSKQMEPAIGRTYEPQEGVKKVEDLRRRIQELKQQLAEEQATEAGDIQEQSVQDSHTQETDFETVLPEVDLSAKIKDILARLPEKKEGVSASSEADISERAGDILGPHKSFASFTEYRFSQHISSAEQYLKQGRYYRAADAYTLALIYKPGDPLAYAGKSHALFAAGEYISSALFLSRALIATQDSERMAEVFRFGSMALGLLDKDKLETRIADVEQWLETSGAAELEFLLGYVYYQTGKLQKAKEAIDAAYEKVPGSPAVEAVKKAIDDALR